MVVTMRSPLNHNRYFSICYNQADKRQKEDKNLTEKRDGDNLGAEDVRKQRVDMRVCKAIASRRRVEMLAGIV